MKKITMASKNPTFTIYKGGMFSGKTSRLLSTLDRFKYQHKTVVVFKPKMDDRYSGEEIVSHVGFKFPAISVDTAKDVLGYLANLDSAPDVVVVDEAFMIPGIASVLIFLFRNGFNVVVSSLDISATGKPFSEIEQMLPWGTHIETCAAVCTVCGADAYYTHKKNVEGDEEIQIGGSELYEARCMSHQPMVDKRSKLV